MERAAESVWACRHWHRAAEDATDWIRDHIVEPALLLIGDLFDDVIEVAVPPLGNRTACHEQDERTIGLNREAANPRAAIALFMFSGRGVVAEQLAAGNIGPVKALLHWMPQGILADMALIVSNEFGLYHRTLSSTL